MEPYREPAGFCCTAEELLEIFLALEGHGIEKHKSSLIKIVQIVYGELTEVDFPYFIMLILCQLKLQKFWRLVELGKERCITCDAWLQAIENTFANG